MEDNNIIRIQALLVGFNTRKKYNLRQIYIQKGIVKEAVETEESLLKKMKTMKDIYQPPLKQVNIDETSYKVHLIFEYLDACIESSQQIVKYGKQFLENYKIDTQPSQFFSFVTFHLWAYGEYTINYNITKTMLNELTKNIIYQRLLSIIDSKQPHGWVISDLIIEPMQRTPRYPLLLNTLIKVTNENNNDYQSLLTVKKDYDYFTALVNEKTVMRDNLRILAENMDFPQIIIPRRYYIGGDIMAYNKKKCEGHLFNDRIIWFAVSKGSKIGKQNEYYIEGEFIFDSKTRVVLSRNIVSLNKYGLMPIQMSLGSKKTAEKWKETINNLLFSGIWDMANENSWMNTVDCHCTFVSYITPMFPKITKIKR
ncbi:hypothetical protein, conserved [Entamoeba dispar SAW760]|uniref:DH domain-containing protein n=1 Tax=Entamoeba dispar (strain ATCC PRA-260 / SAW760) TaxID=370354 RepID=B0EAQ3_ENTDS|nr:uncharacterized protein EDI_017240 [Entamoeba dispar SAW760]EDR28402.1 hypothetical protein, conserved [Entamoeba dispar SAW760]|eukprot:EDR28402.1 hypothetical protein, conserved [Entamoeba dispar SAW760]